MKRVISFLMTLILMSTMVCGLSFESSAAKNTNKITVYYKNSSWSQANIHYQVNGTWTSVPGVKMSESDNSDYTWMYVIDLGDTTSAYVCFNNGKGSWDSKNSSNYYISGSAVGIKNGNIYTIQ